MPDNNERMVSNIIPAEINSEIKITKAVSFRDLVVGFFAFIGSQQLSFLVHPILQLPYIVFCLAVIVSLLLPSAKNPGKKMYQCVLLSFTKDRGVYHACPYMEVPEENENDKNH